MTPRLYIDAPLKSGAIVSPSKAQAHYLTHVLRLSEGKSVYIFNGYEGEWQGTIDLTSQKEIKLRVDFQRRPQQARPDIWLLFSPLKAGRTDLVIEKATELGASQIYLLITQRCTTRRVNLERLNAQSCEAAEQSERLTLPKIHPLQPLNSLLSQWPEDRPLMVCVERRQSPLLTDFLRERRGERPYPLAVCIGPEGGFSESELKYLEKLSYCSFVSLGPQILRAETAAIVALGGVAFALPT